MKKSSSILGILIAVPLLLNLACTTGGLDGSDNSVYTIGAIGPSGVGIVFYITDNGLHGMEAAPTDQNTFQEWIEGGSTQTTSNSATSTVIGSGLANSQAIIAQDGHTGSAAQVCRDYNGGGLSDWFLPSKDELHQLFLQRETVGGFSGDNYWSSSEDFASVAWAQHFNTGGQGIEYKSSSYRVRAIRTF